MSTFLPHGARAPPTLLAVVSLLLASLALSAGTASAAPSTVTPNELVAGASGQWAYGVADNLSGSWTNSSLGYTATIHAYFGLQVTLTQTNRSATTGQVELDRTVALDFDALFCKPTCTNPTASANVSYAAWQRAVGFVNYTSNGTVTVGGVSVPALAITNASTVVVGNLTMQNDTQFRGLLGAQHTDTYYFTVQEDDALALSFSPALGVLPDDLTNVTAWNASSAYAGAGSWSADYRYIHDPWTGTPVDLSYGPSGSLSGSGTVDLYGILESPVTLSDGLTTQQVALSMNGPFHLREGLLFVPDVSDVLASSGQSWSALSAPAASTTTAGLDIGARLGHLGILAGATSYAPTATPLDVGGVTPASTSTTGGATVQAEPETVADSQSGSQCLIAGTCPGQQSSGGITTHSPLGGAVLVAFVLVVVVAVALVVVERRRNVPSAPHPNAELYPPGAAHALDTRATPPTTAPKSAVVPEAGADDPLSNLW